jgi:predicted branched-subunit amino acid permease
MPDAAVPPEEIPAASAAWFLRGVAATFSVPMLILLSAFVGFAGLAHESGLTMAQTVFMTGIVWALPGQVVLIGSVLAGSSLPATAFAVALSSVRLMPMVMALTPEMRGARTRKWVLYLLSHFVAVTSWVIATERLPLVPREHRTAYYGGIGSTLVLANMLVVAIVFLVAPHLPTSVSAGLFLLTPIYFLTSLWGSARDRSAHFAMVLGVAVGPVFHVFLPGFDLLAGGLVGGFCAFALERLVRARRGR